MLLFLHYCMLFGSYIDRDDSMDVDILDLDVEGAIDLVLRDSYKSLPHFKYVNFYSYSVLHS